MIVATFNCENLFVRYRFSSKLAEEKKNEAVDKGFIIERSLFETVLEEERKLTAGAILATKADIIALQEVENLDTLKSFQSRFLKAKFPFKYLIDGNDMRLIDIAALSNIEATSIRTHQYDKGSDKKQIFSRDCLEIEYNVNGVPLTLFINHFKSMLDKSDPANGRQKTMAKRRQQSEQVVQIIKDKFGSKLAKENFIVLGDLNDYLPSTGLKPLLDQPWLENVVQTRLPAEEQWTHWWSDKKSVSQLDYILLSSRLAKNSPAKPVIIRCGLGTNCTQFTGKRLDGIGKKSPVASDHCPVAMEVNVR
ncbi:MAG TPA: endonuclease/exonuclease/phosphatase family protein [Flavipsychrobacter sp.]|nr:endonuclease/exonuclease/phosphatase family protein [Flavipsychrobacter sp.]